MAMRRAWILMVAAAIALSPALDARAGNQACWGDDSRVELSCTALTESLLVRLRGATKAQAVAVMAMPGQDRGGGLRWISNHGRGGRGSGTLSVTFDAAGRVSRINAMVDPGDGDARRYVWDDLGHFCSDLPGSRQRCDGGRR
jgi:hypothetical protein